jgi:DNA polymerase III gamma/tau subunit
MARDWRIGALWVIAVLFAAVLVGWAVISWRGDAQMQVSRGMGGPPAPQATAPAIPASAAVADAAAACRDSPLLARKGDDDGQERLQAKPAGASADEVASLIRTGKEAAASGRQHDAEVSFLNACRNAAQLQGDDAVALADAMYQLARLYANTAALGAKKPQELYERAARLYEASLAAYTGRYGPGHEKTKFAQQGLETVRLALGPAAATAKAPAPAPQPAPAPEEPVAQAPAPEPAPEAAPAAEPGKEAKAPAPEKKAEAPEPKKAEPVKEAKVPEPAKRAEPVKEAKAPEPVRPAARKETTTAAPAEDAQADAAPPRTRARQTRAEPPEREDEPVVVAPSLAEPPPPPPPSAFMGAPAFNEAPAPAAEAPVVVVPEPGPAQ